MILHRAQLKGWKCFAAPISLGPFSPGLNILFAENGTGKSTLFEALRRGLLDSHRVSGEELQRLRPWGTELTPSIAIEFEARGARYLVTKTFLDQPSATLFRKDGEQFTPVAEDDAVHKRLLGLFRASPSSRGLSKEPHWGLTQVLWAPQGNLALSSLSTDVVSSIRTSLSYQFSGAEGEEITRELAKMYQHYFTPNGKYRSGKEAPEFMQLKERLLTLEHSREELQTQLVKVESSLQELLQVRTKRQTSQETIVQLKQAQHHMQEQVKVFELCKKRLEVLTAQLHAVEAKFSELNSLLFQIATQKQELQDRKTRLAQLTADSASIQREVTALDGELSSKRLELERQRKLATELQQRVEEIHHAEKFVALVTRLKENMKQLHVVASLKDKITLQQDTIKNTPVITKAQVQSIRGLLQERKELQFQLNNAQVCVQISPQTNLEIIHLEKQQQIAAGATQEFRGDHQVSLELSGIAQIVVSGSAQTTSILRAQLEALDQDLLRQTSIYGTQDLERLESLYEQRALAQNDLERSNGELQALLAGQSEQRFITEHQTLLQEHALLLERFPGWTAQLPNPKQLAQALTPSRETTIRSIQVLEGAWEETLQRHGAACSKYQTALAHIFQLTTEIQSLSTKEQELARRQESPESDQQRLRELAIERDTKKLLLEEENKKLSAFGIDPHQELQRLDQSVQALLTEEQGLVHSENMLQATLETLSAQGLYSKLSALEEEIASDQQRIAREEKRALALKLLYETLLICKTEALQAVVKPVEQQVLESLATIGVTKIRQVKLNETLLPDTCLPDSTDVSVLLREFSGGEQEQIHFVVRLALAEALAREERQFVVFDDVLTATDSKRVAKLLELFRRSSERLQVFILTCQPEKFLALQDATWFELERIVAESKQTLSTFAVSGESA